MGVESIILSALLPVIRDKLISPGIQQLSVAFGTTEKLQKLKRIFERIQSVIVDAEERQTTEPGIKIWLSDLKDLAYEAEDVLDDFDYEAQRKSLNQQDDITRKVLSYCSFYKPIMTRFRLGRRLNDIIEKIEARAREIREFNFQLNKVPQISSGRPQTHSYVDKETVIGREKDKEDIVSFLINHDVSNNKKIMVLPIVAMGGMGKTTLCQLVYRDHRVESHFQLLIWVCVSDADFDVTRLVRLIIEAATKGECKLENMELLQDRLREIISGKRYLIVLDDVWNENPNQWNRLKTLLDCGGEGSVVVVSTRSTKAAKMMHTHTDTIYDLKQLPEEDSWELFRRRAFGEGPEQPENLVEIGKDIIKRCGGLPLAICTLGSMMYSEYDEEKWMAVLDNDIWKTQAAKEDIMPALRLSYNHLPSHLKQCFAFCAIYPKDYEMEKEQLIQLWMANGYIPSDGARDLDVIGRDIFDELVWRSFFQNVEEVVIYDTKNYKCLGYHGIVTCKMHDLMHDLAQSIMGKECLNVSFEAEVEKYLIDFQALHLLMLKGNIPSNLPILPNIRTLFTATSSFGLKSSLIKHPSMPKSSRVLSLGFWYFNKNVNISHLRHLRWLDLSHLHHIKKLPEGICSLYNLQTLILSKCSALKKLPENFTNLVNLRHLYTDECSSLVRMPRGMGRLKQLHTLTRYIVSAEAERGLKQLRDLNLGGKLKLYGIENVSNPIDAKEASLSSKQNLRSIALFWGGAGSLEVFDALQPHDGLRMLAVHRYGGQQFPKWMNNPQQLQNLVNINLKGCGECKDLPPLGQLPLLEVLELTHMRKVKYIISKTTWCDTELNTKLFPSLKTFKIFDMENLEDWWEAEGSNAQVLRDTLQFLPCLTKLSITNCKNLTTIPAIPSLQDLMLYSSNPNLITNIFSLTTVKGPEIFQLQKLRVVNYQGLVHLPACFTSIRTIEIERCNRLESLPAPGSLTKLQKLKLRQCDDLAFLPQGMEVLANLEISYCNRLTSLPEDLLKLDSLLLDSCDGLASLPQGIEGLTKLDISRCNGLTSLPEGLIKLRDLESLPAPGSLTKLQKLKLLHCGGLVSLPQGMEALTDLKISFCNRLTSLPEDLIKLESLLLNGCDGLTSLPQKIEGLTKLNISRCNGLTLLPEGLIKLRNLILDRCDSLVSIPEMEGFTDLRLLKISNCNRLRSLPEGLRLRLSSLTRLTIIGHHELTRSSGYRGYYFRQSF